MESDPFMDKRQLVEYRSQSRKQGISDKNYNDILTKFYSFYIDKRTAFLKLFPFVKTGGKRSDGTIDLGIAIIMKSSTDKNVLLQRVPLIYKSLTALHATPYQAITAIQHNMKDMEVVIQYDHSIQKSPPSIYTLRSYADMPYRTSISIYKNNIIITLFPL